MDRPKIPKRKIVRNEKHNANIVISRVDGPEITINIRFEFGEGDKRTYIEAELTPEQYGLATTARLITDVKLRILETDKSEVI